MAAPLPQVLVRSFTIANQSQDATDQSVFYGPYIRLLYYFFGLNGDFEIQQQFDNLGMGAGESIDALATFTVEQNQAFDVRSSQSAGNLSQSIQAQGGR
jgi:hypothetical protein